MDECVGRVRLTDGTVRYLYQDGDGRHYIIDEDGNRVPAVWMSPESDKPVIVETGP